MRIAVFIKATTHHKGYGGLETQNLLLCEELARRNHDVLVFSPQRELKYKTKYSNGVKYHFVPSVYRLTRLNKKNWFHRSLKAFEKYNKESPFDLVLSQSSAGLSILEKRKDFVFSGVSIAHGTIMGELRTRIDSYSGVKDLYSLIKDIIFGLRVFFGRQRAFVHSSDKVIAVSSAVKTALIKETFVSEKKVVVVKNGIDSGELKDIPDRTDSTDVIYVGQIIRSKGSDEFLEIAEDPEMKNTKFHLLGDGDLRDNLEDQVEEKGLSEQFKFYGKVPHKKVMKFLAAQEIAVFAFPTKRFEGLPMVLVEAMFAGLPIVAYDIGGVSDVVKDSETGFLVKAGDRNEFKASILRILSSQDLRVQMSKNAREFSLKNLTVKSMVNRYEEVFMEALEIK